MLTSGQRIVHVCKTALANGPIGYSHDRAYYRAFVACGYDQDLSQIKTSCGVFVRAVLHWAGRRASRPGRIGQPVNGGWLEGMTFNHPAWVWNEEGAKPTPGCIFARDYTKATTNLYHVGIFIEEIADDIWVTAEGGGGDGTECRLSAPEGKYIHGVDGLNRRVLGWWRPEALGLGPELTPGMPTHEPPEPQLLPFPGLAATSKEFRHELIAMAKRLDIDPNAVAAVMCIESRFKPNARNPHVDENGESAVGLIQFMPFLLRHWGLTVAEVEAMSSVQQLALVERFYANAKGVKDPGTLYMLTFMPAAAFEPDDFVLGEKDSSETHWGLSLHKIYAQNAGLDTDKDGDIEVGEVKWVARTVYGEALYDASPMATLREGAGMRPKQPNDQVKVVQKAVGTSADGRFGPATAKAVKAYQKRHGLVADAIVGPKTWAKILGEPNA